MEKTGTGKELVIAEYLWLDANQELRSKGRVLPVAPGTPLENIKPPVWGFDGSSTGQAEGHSSDCVLRPQAVYPDPIRTLEWNARRSQMGNTASPVRHILVLNEVELPTGEMHPSNTRAPMRRLAQGLEAEGFQFGIEQEYALMREGRPLGFPAGGFPAPQGPYYCSIGANQAFGRSIIERHMQACLEAGLSYVGYNSEVMPGQWEFQIFGDPLTAADHLTVARYLLERIAETEGVSVSFAAKPINGDWNGSGAHTNFSTTAMRESDANFPEAIERLRLAHAEHIAVYGKGIEDRLTGKHETCSYKDFRSGVSDRGASIRIPWQVAQDHKGYLEDRRPCANMDPYLVIAKIMNTVGGPQESPTRVEVTR